MRDKWYPVGKDRYSDDTLRLLLFEFLDLAMEAAENQTDYPSWRVFVMKRGYNPGAIRAAIKRRPEVEEIYQEVMAALPELKVLAARYHDKSGDVVVPWQLVRLDLMSNHGWSEKAEKKFKGDAEEPLVIKLEREIIKPDV